MLQVQQVQPFCQRMSNDTPGRNFHHDTDDSLLRMTDDEHAYASDHTNGEDFDIALNM